jgi:hypothetical protein
VQEQGTNSPDLSRWGNHVNHNFSAPGFIKDKNDNSPFFPKQHYTAEGPETPTSAPRCWEVIAEDLDTEASETTYSSVGGYLGFTGAIEPQTMFIQGCHTAP